MIKQFFSYVAQQLRPGHPQAEGSGFGATIALNSKPAESLDDLRERVWWTLSNCDQPNCSRLATQIIHAQDAASLWALRSDMFQCIAQSRGQAYAIERIEDLQRSFVGWLPSSVLARSSEFGQSGFRASTR